jgi:hypothetical protein
MAGWLGVAANATRGEAWGADLLRFARLAGHARSGIPQQNMKEKKAMHGVHSGSEGGEAR